VSLIDPSVREIPAPRSRAGVTAVVGNPDDIENRSSCPEYHAG